MNLHDELARLGADATAGSKDRLASVEVAHAVGARVRHGRRARTMGGVGAVAAVALLAVGAWAVLPGGGAFGPAGDGGGTSAGPYSYQATSGSPAGAPQVELTGEGAVACGDELQLTPGVLVHDEAAASYGIRLGASLGSQEELAMLLSDHEEDIYLDGSGEPMWAVAIGADALVFEAVAIARDADGAVTGIGQSTGGSGSGSSLVTGGAALPHVGQCDDSAAGLAGQVADPLDTVLVGQFWRPGAVGERTLMATIVVDPTVEPSAGATYAVGVESATSDVVPLDLRTRDSLQCGATVDLQPGVTVHDESVIDAGVSVTAASVLASDSGDRVNDPGAWWVGYESHAWETSLAAADSSGLMIFTVPLLVRDGASEGAADGSAAGESVAEVVGVGVGSGAGGDGALATDPEDLWTPVPGACNGGGEVVGESADGGYRPVLVAQVWSASLQQALATVVVDAGVLDLTGLGQAQLDPGPEGPATLQPSQGPAHQAFVVPPPEQGSCTPYADQVEQGQPGALNVEYQIELPGLTDSFTGELWATEPVVTLPDGEEPWYLGLDAWLVADDVNGGIPDPHLEWTSLSVGGWALAPGGSDRARADDCAFTLPIPQVQGAVFLVIDGVDTDAVEEAAPGVSWAQDPDTLQTWVYLGDA